ncbi:protein phosphatase CheZ [Massilia sp. DWR3-1-1]|uniref:protein phosphatase CheZ n=1 Tax=Massilia sp. DWR3-1-1 TaxID=2804559 RepID=UPI003CFA27DF
MTDAADDFDALFDEVSAQRDATPAAAPTPTAATAQDIADDDFEALFEQAAAQTVAAPAPAPAPVAVAAVVAAADADGEGNAADKPMFERLGGIVRLLHDSLRELGYDKALTEASTQINDAQDRLEYVATLTEQAANKVLNTLDEGMPAQDVLSKNAKQMETRWADLFAGKVSIDDFKTLAGDSQAFAQAVTKATDAEKARLLDIIMAQDFQDITGQLIKKVVAITKTVEHELAELLRDNAPPAVREKLAAKPGLMSGPSVPSVALDQDNVDDLLADLGF